MNFPICITFLCVCTRVLTLSDTFSLNFLPLLGSDDAVPKSKTAALIKQRTEFGRVVLLLCTKTCAKLRQQIPAWLKEFNNAKKYEGIDIVSYYYHTFRQPVTFFNHSDVTTFPNLIYFIGTDYFVYNDDINDKDLFTKWLTSLDETSIRQPETVEDLDELLSSTFNCSNKLLFIGNLPKCPMNHWKHVSRVAHRLGVTTVHLKLPMSYEMHQTIFKRMPEADGRSCQFAILVYENSYSELNDYVTPPIVQEWIEILLPKADDNCPVLFEDYWSPLKVPLTDLERTYFAGEMSIEVRNDRPMYVMVGMTGGIAVVILAMSIFWGLNGMAQLR